MAQLADTSLFNDANLVAYYKTENVNDSKASYNLTNNNSVAFVAGKYNNAADFGAANTNKSLTINNNLGIAGGNCSISCWVKLNAEIAAGSWSFVGQCGSNPNWERYQLGYDYNAGSRCLAFTRVKNDVAAEAAVYTVALGTSSWHHLVQTYDGTNLRGYLDGTLVAGPTAASGNGGTANGHNEFSIGASPDGSNTAGAVESFASALIDDVAIFSRALSQADVTTLYQDAPTVTTSAAQNVGATTADVPGNVTSDGGVSITERGVCYNTTGNPTTSDSKKIVAGTTGAFTANLTGLSPNQTYHCKAYAINSLGTSYGAEVDLTTIQNYSLPTITNLAVAQITKTSAIISANVLGDGNATITERGVCWGTHPVPDITDNVIKVNGTTGKFFAKITGLAKGTKYYARAYAKNSQGVAYG